MVFLCGEALKIFVICAMLYIGSTFEMSRYRTLFTEERNSHIPLLAVSNEIYKTDRSVESKISPANPVPEQTPSMFSASAFALQNHNTSHLSQDQYGIKANGYKSLRYYGNGPY